MNTIILILVLLSAVLISSLLDQVIPRVSLPLIQIGMGVACALFAPGDINITLEPELFMVIFIAPLLFGEAKETNRVELWTLIKPVLSLAVGLVILSTLIIGFAVHAAIPSIPLAAAFALAAALGPTDAIAVSSLASQIDIPPRQQGILRGELLLNDASGIVSFQFAVAAATGTAFSILHATNDFALEFVGGLILGLLVGFLGKFVSTSARSMGIENTMFHVLFELTLPFMLYMVADQIGVSGVIAVVACGLTNVTEPEIIGPNVSRMNIVSSSVWRVLTFALNGIVFVLLGTQLPSAFTQTWPAGLSMNSVMLVAYVIGITALSMAIRFMWVLVSEGISRHKANKQAAKAKAPSPLPMKDAFRSDLSDPESTTAVLDRIVFQDTAKLQPIKNTNLKPVGMKPHQSFVKLAKDSLITTLCGAKGTVTLSIMLTLPYLFPQRELLITLACGVILLTLLIATFIVPLIAPKQEAPDAKIAAEREEMEHYLNMLMEIVEELTLHQTPENRMATRHIINSYNARIRRTQQENDIQIKSYDKIRLQALDWEREYYDNLLEEHEEYAFLAARAYQRINAREMLIEHSNLYESHIGKSIRRLKVIAHSLVKGIAHVIPILRSRTFNEEYRRLRLEACRYVIGKLYAEIKDTDEVSLQASTLLIEYQGKAAALRKNPSSIKSVAKATYDADLLKYQTYSREIHEIQRLYEEGKLSRKTARRLRNNVSMMILDLESQV